jgi:hypothetical protein
MLWYFCEFLMHLPHTIYGWHVLCYISRIHNTYSQNNCFLSRLYNDTSGFVRWQSTLLCLVTHRCTQLCHLSKYLIVHRLTSQLLHTYSTLRVWFPANTRDTASVILWKASAVNVSLKFTFKCWPIWTKFPPSVQEQRQPFNARIRSQGATTPTEIFVLGF